MNWDPWESSHFSRGEIIISYSNEKGIATYWGPHMLQVGAVG